VIGNRINEKELNPLKQGGTGSRSEFEEQPDSCLTDLKAALRMVLLAVLSGVQLSRREGSNRSGAMR